MNKGHEERGKVELEEFTKKDHQRALQIKLYAVISAATLTLILTLFP